MILREKIKLTCVSVEEMSSWFLCVPLVPEGGAFRYGTLRKEWHAVVVLRASLVDSVPMNGQLNALHAVVHIDDHSVALANLVWQTWELHLDHKNIRQKIEGKRNAISFLLNVIYAVREYFYLFYVLPGWMVQAAVCWKRGYHAQHHQPRRTDRS